jgi:hypothetical protein
LDCEISIIFYKLGRLSRGNSVIFSVSFEALYKY